MLTAFAVVLGTLVVQGMTLVPLVRLLGLDGNNGTDAAIAAVRHHLARAALESLDGKTGTDADYLRQAYATAADESCGDVRGETFLEKHRLGLVAIAAQRRCLEQMRADQQVDADDYLALQEELDFRNWPSPPRRTPDRGKARDRPLALNLPVIPAKAGIPLRPVPRK